jgi:hypothetical protein
VVTQPQRGSRSSPPGTLQAVHAGEDEQFKKMNNEIIYF